MSPSAGLTGKAGLLSKLGKRGASPYVEKGKALQAGATARAKVWQFRTVPRGTVAGKGGRSHLGLG